MIGIYKITNTDNGKVYIGQTKDFSHRQACHIYDLKVGRHKNPYMQADYFINPNAFKYEMICQCNADELDDLETFYINKYKSADRRYGYNMDSSAKGKGKKAEETKRKMSECKIGNKAMCGIKLSDEWKKHLSEAQPHKKRVKCIETEIIYDSFADASRKTGIDRTKIVSVCTGRRKSAGGYHFIYADKTTSD